MAKAILEHYIAELTAQNANFLNDVTYWQPINSSLDAEREYFHSLKGEDGLNIYQLSLKGCCPSTLM
ncbi:MAG: hypothetical protein OXC82_03600 [Rhodobacteraceae bacterium]|nr:hypothetical protein [Paracoccaceae bacterium]MCY4249507.1 hypothetical protein [Paracoccaceae bacterium]MCY4308333.1 hypothetical protein [Paracoccaceae bacterium]